MDNPIAEKPETKGVPREALKTADGLLTPAPPKKPWNDTIKYQQAMVAMGFFFWCRSSSTRNTGILRFFGGSYPPVH